jgi:hypothetical protein
MHVSNWLAPSRTPHPQALVKDSWALAGAVAHNPNNANTANAAANLAIRVRERPD